MKPAGPFRLETRPAPPVYRTPQLQAGVQLKPANFRGETRQAPPVYRPQAAPAARMNAAYVSIPNVSIPNISVQRQSQHGMYQQLAAPVRSGVVQRMMDEDDDPVNRLIRSHERNLKEKAEPKKERSLFDLQKSSSYGFTNTDINEGFLKGSYRKGWGGQPFLSLNKDDYGGSVVGSDYDAIVAVLGKQPDQQRVAEAILARIDHGTEPTGYPAEILRAMSTLIQLTQVIESHDSRVTGSDKWARASLTRILNAESSFHLEFNRKDGNYLPARAKSGGSKFGGQEAALALIDKPKKSHKARRKDVLTTGVSETLAELSESSGEEDTEDGGDGDVVM